jgi:hypothetical protein
VAAPDTRFDFSSAVGTPANEHRRNFVFNPGFYNDTDATGTGNRFVISASNNAGRSGAYPKNPDRAPFAITASGWYTFDHRLYDIGGGVLAVELRILDASNHVLKTWTLSDPRNVIGETVGGNQYGWFALQEFPFLAIDNTRRITFFGPPTNMNACKNGEWQRFNTPRTFSSQGDCVQFVNTGQ